MTYFFEEIFKQEKDKLKLKENKENIYSNSIDDILASIVIKDGKSKVYFYTKNQLGSITSLTDEKGKVVEEYKYDVLGKAYIRNGKSENWREFSESKINNTNLFTGREFDREIGLSYYRARYYSAEFGRFISRDPIGQIDDINLYSYVGNNSVNLVDPSGLEKALMMVVDRFNYLGAYFENLYSFDTHNIFADITLDPNLGNIKLNPEIRDLADFIASIKNGEYDGKKININGKDIWLADLGNILYGYNGEKVGYSLPYLKIFAFLPTAVSGDGGFKTDGIINNELENWKFYDAGFQLAKDTTTGKLSKDDLLDVYFKIFPTGR